VSEAGQNVRVVGRYALYGAIAAGGMASVHLGRLLGPVGFSRTVAIKRLHAQYAADPEFVSMFLDEARLAARIRHPNVVPTLDVVATGGELFLVMEYVAGESIARLARAMKQREQTVPVRIVSAVMAGVLHGLHAAHEAKDERGHPLGIVHRDMSPQNVRIGTDGVARVLDLGVAKAAGRMQTTREGQIKGKLAYMPPEQFRDAAVSRQTDIYAAGVVLWELLAGQRLFGGENEGAIVAKVLAGQIQRPSMALMTGVGKARTLTDKALRTMEALDETVMRAVSMAPSSRFSTAREMALEIEAKAPPATASEVADWIEGVARDVLDTRAAMVAEIESSTSLALPEGRERDDQVARVLSAQATLGGGGAQKAQPPVPNTTPMGVVPPAPSSATRLDRPRGSERPLPDAAPTPRHGKGRTEGGGPGVGHTVPLGLPAGVAVEGPPFTQPSSISVSATRPPIAGPDPPRRGLGPVSLGILFGSVVLLGGAIAYRVAGQVRRATEPVAAAPDRAPAPSASIIAADPAGTVSTPTVSLPPMTPASLPDASAPSDEPAAARSGSRKDGPKRPGGRSTSTSTSTASSNTVSATPATAPVSSTAQPPTPPASITPTPAPAPAPGASTDECTPPYYYDDKGIKRYKPQCADKLK